MRGYRGGGGMLDGRRSAACTPLVVLPPSLGGEGGQGVGGGMEGASVSTHVDDPATPPYRAACSALNKEACSPR